MAVHATRPQGALHALRPCRRDHGAGCTQTASNRMRGMQDPRESARVQTTAGEIGCVGAATAVRRATIGHHATEALV
eukprot:5851920-Prymnesium_polylepis.1